MFFCLKIKKMELKNANPKKILVFLALEKK